MKVALSTNVADNFLMFAVKIVGRSLTLWPGSEGPDQNFLACEEDFNSFEEGRPHIEEVRTKLQGYIPGPLKIYIKLDKDDVFISLADYAVMCERGRDIWRRDALEQEQRGL